MKTKKWIFVTGIAVAVLVAAIFLVPAALAQGPRWGYGPGFGPGRMFNQGDGFGFGRGRMFNGNFGPGAGFGPMFGQGPRRGGPENSLITAAAEQLGLSTDELIDELQSGKTIADVAKEHDVALETIVEAVIAPRAERLAELVDSEEITQEEADAMLVLMRARVTDRLSQPWTPRGNGDCDYPQGGGRRGGPMGRFGWLPN